jgi:hypothetical protein
MSDPMVTEQVVSAAPAAAPWEDVLDIFYAPRQVFERRRDGKYLIPLLIACVVTVAVFFLSSQLNEAVQDAEMSRAFREQGLTGDKAVQAKAMAQKFAGLVVYLLPVFVAIGSWISGLLIMLVGNAMGGKFTFAQGTTIAVLASLPEVLGRVLVGVQGLFLETANVAHRYSFSINASRFLPADSNKWLLKLGALADPFVIWGIVLTGFGALIIGRMEKEKAAVLAIIIAVVGMALFR